MSRDPRPPTRYPALAVLTIASLAGGAVAAAFLSDWRWLVLGAAITLVLATIGAQLDRRPSR